MTWDELKTHELVVYSTPWCGDCRRLKSVFAEKGVEFEEIDIDSDQEAAKRLQEATGKQAIPYVQIDGGEMIRGWHSDEPGSWNEDIFLQEAAQAIS